MDAQRIVGGLFGVAVGDALGVPVEFRSREAVRRDPVLDMRGYGTHNQPKGTWSDDTSTTLCLVEELLSRRPGEPLSDDALTAILDRLLRWRDDDLWTARGDVFDIGNTTTYALSKWKAGIPLHDVGIRDEKSIGNGSLMRSLPVAIAYVNASDAALLDAAHAVSRLTHAHPRAQMACGIYCLYARSLLRGNSLDVAYRDAVDGAMSAYPAYRHAAYSDELGHFASFLSGELLRRDESEVKTDTYAVDTLEAALWTLHRARDFRDAVLTAVNLGLDTDTVGAVTGGLAGIRWGFDAIPKTWIQTLARSDELRDVFERFAAHVIT
jgi:ADP-ribosylglycohydrolase